MHTSRSLIQRTLLLLLAALLLFTATASAKPKSKGGSAAGGGGGATSNSNRQARLVALSRSSGGAVDLESFTYTEFTSSPRNYSITTLLTALGPQFGCAPCKAFQPEYERLAKGWAKKGDQTHFFATLDFLKGKDIFQKMALQHAPALLYFPPTTGPRASGDGSPLTYDFNRAGFEAEDLANWLSQESKLAIGFEKPFPWETVLTFGTGAAAAGALILFAAPRLGGLMRSSKIVWELMTLAVVIVMCSGYMWNQIRGAPWAGRGQNGKVEYFAGGFQNQYAAETQIVAAIYALLAFSMVALIIFVPKQRDPVRQRMGVYVWSAVFLGTFSLLFAIFRLKNPSYPFRLFL